MRFALAQTHLLYFYFTKATLRYFSFSFCVCGLLAGAENENVDGNDVDDDATDAL